MDRKDTLAGLVGSYDNLDEPVPLSNKPETVLGICITFQVLTWVCGLLRLWTRFRIVKAPGWDDLFVVLSLITTSLGTIMICVGVEHYGLGKHFVELGGEEGMSTYLKGFYIANGSYMLSTSLIKMALLLQYLRVFSRGTFLYRFCVGLLVFVGLWGLSFSIVAWFPCSPAISEYWSLNPEANCWGFASQDPMEFQVTFKTHTALNMVLDLIILSIPIALYFQSDVQSKTRWGLTGVLILGGVANFASIWRLATIVEHRAATEPTFDPSWYGCVSILLSAVEVDLAVICASVPVFWPVLQANGFQIFITKEVRVTSEDRMRPVGEDAERIELQYAGAMPAGSRGKKNSFDRAASLRSHTGSEDNLHKANSGYNSNSSYREDKYELSDDIEQSPTDNRWLRSATHVKVSVNNHDTMK